MIKQILTTYNRNQRNSRDIKYIVIHYVGATGGAKANCEYYASKYIGASAHYFVGHSGEIYQSVLDKDIAWHCGAKTYKHGACRNANSIGVELCCRFNGSWYFEQETVDSAIVLVKELMHKYGLNVENILRHYDVTGKNCPAPFVENEKMWDEFKKALVENFEETSEKPVKSECLKLGSTGEAVKEVQKLLSVAGYDCGQVDGIFGDKTKNAVTKFQSDNGLTVDGIVGEKTMSKLRNMDSLVVEYQKELNKQFNSGLTVDGIFGVKTKNATVNIKKGATGNLTKILQKALNRYGNDLTVDGIFGIKTDLCVRKFQKENGLVVDGIVGKNTWEKLLRKGEM